MVPFCDTHWRCNSVDVIKQGILCDAWLSHWFLWVASYTWIQPWVYMGSWVVKWASLYVNTCILTCVGTYSVGQRLSHYLNTLFTLQVLGQRWNHLYGFRHCGFLHTASPHACSAEISWDVKSVIASECLFQSISIFMRGYYIAHASVHFALS